MWPGLWGQNLGYYTFMALEYGPLRERLEAYILDRTANHPALVLWHRDNSIGELFERLYDEGAESVEREIERRSIA